MKKILCFGDSNTYGYIPGSGARYSSDSRWPAILKDTFKDKFLLIEEGCNNRTCFANNPDGDIFTGYKILPKLLSDDIDCVILAIGVNDLQKFYRPSDIEIASGIENLVAIVRRICPVTKIIIASPSNMTLDVLKSNFSLMFDELSVKQSEKMSELYRIIADKCGCYFIDLNKIAKVSELDGLHYSKDSHIKIAYALKEIIDKIFEH